MQQNNQQLTAKSKLSFRSILPYALIATLIFIIALVTGLLTPLHLTGSTMEDLKQLIKPLEAFNAGTLFLVIFINNAIKALGAIVFGILLGLPSIFFIGTNGFILGIVVSALKADAGYGVIIASLAPHGIIEIPLLILSTSLGMSIGIESLRYLMKQRSAVKTQIRLCAKFYVKWILTGLLIAALIEIFLTPLVVSLVGSK